MKIYFINSKEEKCGVYQYGLRLWNILKDSDLDISYFEIDSIEKFYSLNFAKADLLLFNFIYHGTNGPFSWYTRSVAQYVQSVLKIKTATINHTNFFYDIKFDYFIDQDPENGLPRPLFFTIPTNNKTNSLIPQIGSFGFANGYKGFNDIVRFVNDQFEEAQINLHITKAHYISNSNELYDEIVNKINSIVIKPGIKLNITSNFLNNTEMLDFISNNDIVLFAYTGGEFTSSVVDYPISTETPIGVTNCKMFKHVYNEYIDINKYSILEILNYNKKTQFTKHLKEKWSEQNLIDALKRFLATIQS